MKVALICFSLTGQQTGERLCRGLEAAGMTAELDKKSKYLLDSIQISTSAWAGEKFSDSDALIFIGATGIAVRSIAPYVASKKSDPAVLVVDECGKFVISLLSGHLGGANELALKTAEILEAIPVVTTATDLHHRFAVDVFAKKNNVLLQSAAVIVRWITVVPDKWSSEASDSSQFNHPVEKSEYVSVVFGS